MLRQLVVVVPVCVDRVLGCGGHHASSVWKSVHIWCWCGGCLCGYGVHHLAECYLVIVHHLGDVLVGFVGVLFSQVGPLAGVVGFLLEPGEVLFVDDVFPHGP